MAQGATGNLSSVTSIRANASVHLPGAAYDYLFYGLRIRSRLKLTFNDVPGEGTADVEFLPAEADWLENAISEVKLESSEEIHLHEVPGGWTFIRYDGISDFLIAPFGRAIYYRLSSGCPTESFQTYALGRVFSLALVKRGIEPLHASTVVIGGRAVAFLGASTFGKSSLAACFVAAGHTLLTDDILRLREEHDKVLAFPGPPHLKLLPSVARLFMGDNSHGYPLEPNAAKFVYPLPSWQRHTAPTPLAVIYTLSAPREVDSSHPIDIQPLAPKSALLKLLSFTLNGQLNGKDRLERQFLTTLRLVDLVSIRKLTYPRMLSSLPAVRAAILTDLERSDAW